MPPEAAGCEGRQARGTATLATRPAELRRPCGSWEGDVPRRERGRSGAGVEFRRVRTAGASWWRGCFNDDQRCCALG